MILFISSIVMFVCIVSKLGIDYIRTEKAVQKMIDHNEIGRRSMTYYRKILKRNKKR
jgi:hypothetical protein